MTGMLKHRCDTGDTVKNGQDLDDFRLFKCISCLTVRNNECISVTGLAYPVKKVVGYIHYHFTSSLRRVETF